MLLESWFSVRIRGKKDFHVIFHTHNFLICNLLFSLELVCFAAVSDGSCSFGIFMRFSNSSVKTLCCVLYFPNQIIDGSRLNRKQTRHISSRFVHIPKAKIKSNQYTIVK